MKPLYLPRNNAFLNRTQRTVEDAGPYNENNVYRKAGEKAKISSIP